MLYLTNTQVCLSNCKICTEKESKSLQNILYDRSAFNVILLYHTEDMGNQKNDRHKSTRAQCKRDDEFFV